MLNLERLLQDVNIMQVLLFGSSFAVGLWPIFSHIKLFLSPGSHFFFLLLNYKSQCSVLLLKGLGGLYLLNVQIFGRKLSCSLYFDVESAWARGAGGHESHLGSASLDQSLSIIHGWQSIYCSKRGCLQFNASHEFHSNALSVPAQHYWDY